MKKKLIAIIAMACAAAFILSACGGGSNTPAGSGATNTPAGSGAAAPQSGSTGDTFDVGNFTVAVPSGWTAFPQTDIFGEKDADGNSPIDPAQILLAKGASNEIAAVTGPNVRINQYKTDSYFSMDPTKIYEDAKELDGVTVGGTACKAYEFDSAGYVYQQITYESGDYTYECAILKATDGKDTGLTYETPEVVTILESITAK